MPADRVPSRSRYRWGWVPPPSHSHPRALILGGVDEEEHPPICPACGVTMVPAALSARERCGAAWICLGCEEHDDPVVGWGPLLPRDRRRLAGASGFVPS